MSHLEKYLLRRNDSRFESNLLQRINLEGLVVFNVTGLDDFKEVISKVGTFRSHPDAVNGVTKIAYDPNLSLDINGGGFSNGRNLLHTDGSAESAPPEYVGMYCERPADEGGRSLFCDGRDIYMYLHENAPGVLQILSEAKTVVFGNPDDSPHVGSIFNLVNENEAILRYRADLLGYYSAQLVQFIPYWKTLIMDRSLSFSLKANQAYVLKNTQWMHGRTEFFGRRIMHRVLFDAKKGQDDYYPKGFIIGNNHNKTYTSKN